MFNTFAGRTRASKLVTSVLLNGERETEGVGGGRAHLSFNLSLRSFSLHAFELDAPHDSDLSLQQLIQRSK